MQFYTWQLYCVTEGIQTQTLGSDAGPNDLSHPPTTCPNNTAHSVQGPAVIATTWNDAPAVTDEGALLQTPSMCPAGWHFESRGLQIVTSTPSSIINRDFNNVDLTDASIKLYDASGTLLTGPTGSNTYYDTCVKTVVYLTPPYDYVLIRGKVMVDQDPGDSCYAHVILAPNIPASYGGQKPMVSNINIGLMANNSMAAYDGISPKRLHYGGGNGGNTVGWFLYHPPGLAFKFEFVCEWYRI